MSGNSPRSRQLHQWLARIDQGDFSAREELLRAIQPRLAQLTCQMLGRFPNVRRWVDPDDVLQNASLRLLRALHNVRPTSIDDLYGLAKEQIRRELIDLARYFAAAVRNGASRTGPLPDSASLEAPGTRGGESDADDLEMWQRFHEAVLELPAEECEVVCLIFYHGWVHSQLAELFHVDERTIRRRWRSACDRLRAQIPGTAPRDPSSGPATPPRTST